MSEMEAPIPGGPSREVLLGYQTAIVERTRALLMMRIADRSGTDATIHRDAFEQWTRTMRGLSGAHSIPFISIANALDLGVFEQDVLCLAVAPVLDGTLRTLIAAFHRQQQRYVDCQLAIELLSRHRAESIAARTTLSSRGRLASAGMIELATPSTPYTATDLDREIVPSPRLLRILDGQVGLDPRYADCAFVVEAQEAAHVGVMTEQAVDQLASMVRASDAAIGARRGLGLLVSGSQGVGKLRVARAVAARLDIPRLLVVETSMLPTDPTALRVTIERLAREASLLDARLVLRDIQHRTNAPRDGMTVVSILRNLGSTVWATNDDDMRQENPLEVGKLASISIAVSQPDPVMREDAWLAELSQRGIVLEQSQLKDLVNEFPITRAAIEDVAAMTAAMPDASWAVVSTLAQLKLPGQLGKFAHRGRSKVRMEHLVLPEVVRDQLVELANAVRRRASTFERWGLNDRHAVGRGIVALFNGPPGTGKTMAANALANELGLPLFRIDTSSIVDRYVGETEKNLMRLFEEAAASRATLLFDEADSLFGKRVEAKDSVDRHANMQINVLLNLIEDYSGFVVLTTNMKAALDSAFLRRIVFKIRFDLPDVNERMALWTYHLPSGIPKARNVDLHALAREFDKVSGGDIKNAVLRAVLASNAQPVTQELLKSSMANELRANGSVISEGAPRSTL